MVSEQTGKSASESSAKTSPKPTPMMKQYLRFKAEHPGMILFFHLGDFYEAFYEDAEILSRELDIVLTSRNGYPMAGVPIRRGTSYMNQLLKKGYKVAVCQQVEDPKESKGLVKRDVVQILTPGTVIDDDVLDPGTNNYLAAVVRDPARARYGLSFLDLSTGEFICTAVDSLESCRSEIERVAPSEVLIDEAADETVRNAVGERPLTEAPSSTFVAPSDGTLGVGEAALRAAAAVVAYVETTQKSTQGQLRDLTPYEVADRVELDPFTISSLELVRPAREGGERGTLLHVLDRTQTSMGRRLLRRRILAPLTDREEIEARLDAVTALIDQSLIRGELRETLRDVHDLERLAGRLGAGRFRPHDLIVLLASVAATPRLGLLLSDHFESNADRLHHLADALQDQAMLDLAEAYAGMLVETPPADPRDGGMIRDGFHPELDALRAEARALRDGLASLEVAERERTGIPSLKVGYNRVFGYYIEVTKTHLDKVPEEYHRRQTLANAERFVIEDLRQIEEKIARAEERAVALEMQQFEEAVRAFTEHLTHLQSVADALAELDVLCGLAEVAHHHRYTRPAFTTDHRLTIRGGRHPVVEQVEEFVPNDLELSETQDLVVLTGPNMAGKSVFLRQTALVSLMAQIGSFVPADHAELPIVDRIFARVGASDALISGVSTFMMEMLEVAAILQRATPRSLIILDEMGRGTSTFDGVSIAWAVAEELARRVRAKTLFATHYQELTRLAEEVPNVLNLHVAVKEVGREVVFLHRVEPGVAAGSYGVHVARLAGLPEHVTDAADGILSELLAEAPLSDLGGRGQTERLPLFGTEDHPVIQKLRRIDPNRMTPLEALQTLASLVEDVDKT